MTSIQPSTHHFLGLAPQLRVADIDAALSLYRDLLGFDLIDVVGTPPVYATLQRDNLEVHLQRDATAVRSAARVYFWTDTLEPLLVALTEAGVRTSGPHVRAYGMTELIVEDPWGNVLTFGAHTA